MSSSVRSTSFLLALLGAAGCASTPPDGQADPAGDVVPVDGAGPNGTGGSSTSGSISNLPLSGTTSIPVTPTTGSAGSTSGTTSGGAATNAQGGAPNTGSGGSGTAGKSAGGGATGSAGTGGTGSSGNTGTGGSVPGPGTIPHGACLDGIQDFTKDGPFKVTTKRSGAVNFWVPGVPAGCKVPVIHLANGTGASCATYTASLQRLATHGFLAACYESTNTGAGDQGITAFDTAFTTFPDLADKKLGSTGHSQGGQAAFTVMALAEKKYGASYIYAGLAMEPASGFGAQPTGTTWQALYAAIKGPMFMFSGLGSDGLVSQSWVQSAYDATSKTEEAYFWTKNGATHIPVPNGEEQEISVPWFRWKLLGDQAACKAFVAIPKTNTKWAQVAAKNQQPCQ